MSNEEILSHKEVEPPSIMYFCGISEQFQSKLIGLCNQTLEYDNFNVLGCAMKSEVLVAET